MCVCVSELTCKATPTIYAKCYDHLEGGIQEKAKTLRDWAASFTAASLISCFGTHARRALRAARDVVLSWLYMGTKWPSKSFWSVYLIGVTIGYGICPQFSGSCGLIRYAVDTMRV